MNENISIKTEDLQNHYTVQIDNLKLDQDDINEFAKDLYNIKAEWLDLLYKPLGNKK
jgi:hypothetical protein